MPDERRASVYFPAGVVLSTVTMMADGNACESESTGFEGVVGTGALLDDLPDPHQLIVQMAGEVYEMPRQRFVDHVNEQPNFRKLIHRYVFAQYTAALQLIACNRLHSASERCATWLLLSDDRAGHGVFTMTHDALALMLGVHRPAATVEASALQKANLIRYKRGRVEVTDRVGLVGEACECYGIVHDAFQNVFR